MTAGGFREADSFFVFVFDVLLMKAEMVWGLKRQGWLWSDITGVADRMVRFTKGVLKIFFLLVSRPRLGDPAPWELESHQLTGRPPDWGNMDLDVSETPKPESR